MYHASSGRCKAGVGEHKNARPEIAGEGAGAKSRADKRRNAGHMNRRQREAEIHDILRFVFCYLGLFGKGHLVSWMNTRLIRARNEREPRMGAAGGGSGTLID